MYDCTLCAAGPGSGTFDRTFDRTFELGLGAGEAHPCVQCGADVDGDAEAQDVCATCLAAWATEHPMGHPMEHSMERSMAQDHGVADLTEARTAAPRARHANARACAWLAVIGIANTLSCSGPLPPLLL